MTEDIAYVVGITPELVTEASLLVSSIEKNCENPEIYVYCAEKDGIDFDEEFLDYVEDKHNLIMGEIPKQDFPISTKHAALIEASRQSDKEYLALLDSDTVVLDDFSIHLENSDIDLFIKPEDTATEYWSSEKSREDWEEMFDRYGFDRPDNTVTTTVDGEEIWPPYFNTGIVITRNNDFPERWLELSSKIDNYKDKDDRFAGQIAAALLSTDYKFKPLTEEYNYPAPRRMRIEKYTKIVHYYTLHDLFRSMILSPKVAGRLPMEDTKQIFSENFLELSAKIPYNGCRVFKKWYLRPLKGKIRDKMPF